MNKAIKLISLLEDDYSDKYNRLMNSVGTLLSKHGLNISIAQDIKEIATSTDDFWSEPLEKFLIKDKAVDAIKSLLSNIEKKIHNYVDRNLDKDDVLVVKRVISSVRKDTDLLDKTAKSILKSVKIISKGKWGLNQDATMYDLDTDVYKELSNKSMGSLMLHVIMDKHNKSIDLQVVSDVDDDNLFTASKTFKDRASAEKYGDSLSGSLSDIKKKLIKDKFDVEDM